MFSTRPQEQPRCGECAPLAYSGRRDTLWLRFQDLHIQMSNAAAVVQRGIHELKVLRADEIARRTSLGDESLFQTLTALEPPTEPSSSPLNEIPLNDWTYRSVASELIAHYRIPGLFLLRYRTFSGAISYQPCSKDIDLHGLFDVFKPHETQMDSVFKQARSWSCIVQASRILPKEVRWILAMIYNFSQEMLRPEVSEHTIWSMRPWLMHWYEVADRLFTYFNIFATAPQPDWFARPMADQAARNGNENAGDTPQGRRRRPAHDTSSSAETTLIRRAVPEPDQQATTALPGPVPAVRSWLQTLPNSAAADEGRIFDPTPGGAVSPKNSQPPSRSLTPLVNSNSLNPRAASFRPQGSSE